MTQRPDLYRTPITDAVQLLRQRNNSKIVGFVDAHGVEHVSGVQEYDSVNDVPDGFEGVARVGNQLITGDGEKLSRLVDMSSQVVAVELGDSISARNGPPMQDENASSGTASLLADGWFNWLNWQAGSPITVIENAAVSGETANQMLARFGTDVLPYNPSLLVLMAGTNDVTDTGSAEQDINDIRGILNYGIPTIIAVPPPRSDALTDDQLSQIIRHRNWILRDCKREYSNVMVVDCYSGAVNPLSVTTAWKSGALSSDAGGVHPTKLGCNEMIRQADIDQIKAMFRPYPLVASASDSYDGAGSPTTGVSLGEGFNLMTGAQSLMLSGGGGTKTGSGTADGIANLPAGYTIDIPANITITISLESRADGAGNNLVLAIVATAAGNIQLTPSALAAKTIDGKWYELAEEVGIDDSANGIIKNVYASLYHSTTYVCRAGESQYNATEGMGAPKQPFVYVVPRWKKESALTFNCRPLFISVLGAGSATIKLGRVSVREYSSRY